MHESGYCCDDKEIGLNAMDLEMAECWDLNTACT